MSEREFSTSDHLRAVKEERWDGKTYWDGANGAKLRVIVNCQGDFENFIFIHAKHMGY